MLNIPREYDRLGRPDSYIICRRGVGSDIPLISGLQAARVVIAALRALGGDGPRVLAWQGYIARNAQPLQRWGGSLEKKGVCDRSTVRHHAKLGDNL